MPKRALKEFKELKDQRLSQALSEGEYVLADKLVNSEQVGLIAKLPSGMRAVAVKVNAESLAGGFVLPGFRVDIVSTLRGGAADSVAKTILQNMLVLAVDTNAQRDPNSSSMLGSTVTLAATPEESQRLSVASVMGELRLTLRTPDDTKIIRIPGSKWDDLTKPTRDASGGTSDDSTATNSAPPVPTLPALPAPPTQPVVQKPAVKEPDPVVLVTHTMTIMNGEYTQKAIFTKDPESNAYTGGGLGRDAEPPPPRRPVTPPPAVAPLQPDDPIAPPSANPARNGARRTR